MRKTKRILFFIFEGSTDITSLGRYFEQQFNSDNCKVMARSTHGDITSDWDTTCDNVLCRIKAVVDDFSRKYKLTYSDFLGIVQVIDTDGVYVSEKRIVTSNHEHPFIDVGKGVIKTRNKWEIADRNLDKSELVDLLVECDEIEGVPYRVFYMSSNLEHVLHNRANCTEKNDKMRLANKFALRYASDQQGFIDFISESDFAVKGGYLESWDFIRDSKKDTRSLERHTNIGLIFDDRTLRH